MAYGPKQSYLPGVWHFSPGLWPGRPLRVWTLAVLVQKGSVKPFWGRSSHAVPLGHGPTSSQLPATSQISMPVLGLVQRYLPKVQVSRGSEGAARAEAAKTRAAAMYFMVAEVVC